MPEVAAALFVSPAARAVPVSSRLVAVRVPIRRASVILLDHRANLVAHFSPDRLVFPELLALTSSAIGHHGLLNRERGRDRE